MKSFDTIVIGLGGMGSSTVFHLASQNVKVLGLEQYTPAHNLGSSHGETRLIRKAYFEHPNYVPLLKRSYSLWKDLEIKVRKRLLHQTGLTIFGEKNCKILSGIKKSASEHSLSIEERNLLDPFLIPKNFSGLFEKSGGYLEVENCIESYLTESKKAGAELHFQESVLSWKTSHNEIQVTTTKETYLAKKVVFTSGPWTSLFLNLPLKVHRVPLFWFETQKEISQCFAFDMPYGFIYGFPSSKESLIKLALHKPGERIEDLNHVNRETHQEDLTEILLFLKECCPFINKEVKKSAVCLYTMSPDENFIIDFYENNPNVIFAAGFSGHGFKFASVIGEILMQLVVSNNTPHPIDFLRMRNF